MRLSARLERDGGFLFRWRSFVPLLLLPAGLLAMALGQPVGAAGNEAARHVLLGVSLAISFAGLAVRWLTVGFAPAQTSGRNTHAQRAAALNTTGAYSLLRHPLYLGNGLAILGVALAFGVWWFAVIAMLAYWLYIERILAAEEAFLAAKFGRDFEAWAATTPAFVPRRSSWRRPELSFSLRTVLRREYSGVLAVSGAYFAIEALLDLQIEGEPFRSWLADDTAVIALFAVSLPLGLVLRSLKVHTRLLHVPGR